MAIGNYKVSKIDINNRNERWVSRRAKSNMSEYQYRVGSLTLPQQKVSCADPAPEVLQELFKANHALGQTNAHSRFTLAQFNVDNPSGATAQGSYAVGLDLNSWSHKTALLESGEDSLGVNMFAEFTYDSTPAAMQCDHWASYDLLLICADAIMTAAF